MIPMRGPNRRLLPFRELELLARALLSVLLAFLGARVAGQETALPQFRTEFCVEQHKRARDSQLGGARLAVDSTTGRIHQDVKLPRQFGVRQGELHLSTQSFGRE